MEVLETGFSYLMRGKFLSISLQSIHLDFRSATKTQRPWHEISSDKWITRTDQSEQILKAEVKQRFMILHRVWKARMKNKTLDETRLIEIEKLEKMIQMQSQQANCEKFA